MIAPNEFYDKITATEVNKKRKFGSPMATIRVENDNPSPGDSVFITFASWEATTQNIEVKAGELFEVLLPSPTEGMAMICAAGKTAKVRCTAWG